MHTVRRLPALLAALLAVGLIAACGSDPEPAETDAQATPERVVSLSPSATETLWAIGAGSQVIAVDGQSNYPADVPTQQDLSGFTPNVEAIIAYQPDLVIIDDAPDDLAAGLQAAGIPLLSQPAPTTLDDAYAQIEQIGAATGRIGDAAELVSRMRTQIAEVVDDTPPAELSYYHELDPSLFSAGSASFVGQLYGLFGLTNIADGADAYPQLSEEFVVTADPDLIFLADVQCCGVTAATVADRAGWAEVAAVRDGRIYELDADVASRWGPRIVDTVERIGEVITEVHAVSAPN
ncbi:ABC transporter substrate-binding protein [Mycolicibacterium chitae]|uniref:Periplasmic binding protein n=1 Tax=Mycolicibacterium chitae TaxID=1792 RepID=A0A3S4SC47_MYCCI|nr:ABC transporter substrate-binding protein [Mycolicibacterium chitae]MCV7109256.1 ABC transporter substrate-binding protein [Mycolicibacterium chitae]BBZ00962.1 ABC transporter substrate-binding protein [Mycolicibacterium chitae]VEG49809.1 periplasmic binding protein [Mycolicibacterium chitae]